VPGPSSGGPGATYAAAGVDLSAGEEAVARIAGLAAATARPGVLSSIGGFGGLFELDLDRYRHPVLVSSTDGLGTKPLVAKALGRYGTLGLDLVAMCADDLVCLGAEPLFLLDYVAVGRLDPDRLAELVEGIAAGCRRAGCALLGGETAEHPGAMGEDDLDVAGFVVGVLEKGSELGAHRVQSGDVLLGLLSPGLRSNGYSLVRRVLLEDARRPLGEPAWPGADRSLGEVLLEPSVIYTPGVLGAMAAAGGALHAAAHITGGGLPGNLPRVLPGDLDAVVVTGSWPRPAIFDVVAEAGGIEEAEMRRVFNLGVGMVLVVEPAGLDAVRRAVAAHGIDSAVIGHLAAGTGSLRWP
jgi:phosphoribosylformylglycinamidine cyclo-ligase